MSFIFRAVLLGMSVFFSGAVHAAAPKSTVFGFYGSARQVVVQRDSATGLDVDRGCLEHRTSCRALNAGRRSNYALLSDSVVRSGLPKGPILCRVLGGDVVMLHGVGKIQSQFPFCQMEDDSLISTTTLEGRAYLIAHPRPR